MLKLQNNQTLANVFVGSEITYGNSVRWWIVAEFDKTRSMVLLKRQSSTRQLIKTTFRLSDLERQLMLGSAYVANSDKDKLIYELRYG